MYDLEVVPQEGAPLADRKDGDFFGFDHVEIAADHADKASGNYLPSAKSQRAEFYTLIGPENALLKNRISAPQALRTAVPEELYSMSWIANRSSDW